MPVFSVGMVNKQTVFFSRFHDNYTFISIFFFELPVGSLKAGLRLLFIEVTPIIGTIQGSGWVTYIHKIYCNSTNYTSIKKKSNFFLLLFRAILKAHGSSQARGRIGATAAGLCHSCSNARSEPCLKSTPQLTEPRSQKHTEPGQGSNPHHS